MIIFSTPFSSLREGRESLAVYLGMCLTMANVRIKYCVYPSPLCNVTKCLLYTKICSGCQRRYFRFTEYFNRRWVLSGWVSRSTSQPSPAPTLSWTSSRDTSSPVRTGCSCLNLRLWPRILRDPSYWLWRLVRWGERNIIWNILDSLENGSINYRQNWKISIYCSFKITQALICLLGLQVLGK